MNHHAPHLDVVACGELLIDFIAIQTGVSLAEAQTFEKAPGGAPANVAVGLARLGRSVGFLGQVGNDEFGDFLTATLEQDHVDSSGVRRSCRARTALAFVSLKADGERDFMFYRHPSADMLWEASEADCAFAARGKLFHFGSITLISEPSRASTLRVLRSAREQGALISYDPNLRLPLWPTPDAARDELLAGLQEANIVKLSREELVFLTGSEKLDAAARQLWHSKLSLLTVTDGANGCWWFTAEDSGHQPGFSVCPVDTTGAGDAFVAGLLAGLIESGFRTDASSLEDALRLANAAGALTVTGRGAIPALPARAVVDAFLHDRPRNPGR